MRVRQAEYRRKSRVTIVHPKEIRDRYAACITTISGRRNFQAETLLRNSALQIEVIEGTTPSAERV